MVIIHWYPADNMSTRYTYIAVLTCKHIIHFQNILQNNLFLVQGMKWPITCLVIAY